MKPVKNIHIDPLYICNRKVAGNCNARCPDNACKPHTHKYKPMEFFCTVFRQMTRCVEVYQ